MSDEPTQIDWILHDTREHTPAPWYELAHGWFKHIPNISADNATLVKHAPTLRTEVIRLREGIEQLYESIGTMETQGNIAIRKALKELIGWS